MHKRKAHNPPSEHAGPTTVPEGTEQGDDAEVWLLSSPCPTLCTFPFQWLRPPESNCHGRAEVMQHLAEYLWGTFAQSSGHHRCMLRMGHLGSARFMWSGAAQAEEEDMLNPLATDMSEPASLGHRRSGRLEERVSFVSGRGSWHPTGGPDTNGTALPATFTLNMFPWGWIKGP